MKGTTITLIVFAAALAGCASHSPSPRRDSTPAVFRAKPAFPVDTSEVVFHALSHVGIRYFPGGSSPDTGFDCSGLVYYVIRQATGVGVPRDTQGLSGNGLEVSAEDLQPGDLVFFNTLGRPYSHVGIYVGDQRFVHAPTRGGTVGVVDMRIPYWQQRYDGARRLDL